MLFNSSAFAIFFPVVTAGYFILPHRFRWAWLLAASCLFYMYFIPVYILILRFESGNYRQNVLSSKPPRKPAEQENTPARCISRDGHSIVLQQLCPSCSVAFFCLRQFLKNFGAGRVLLSLCERAIKRDPILLAKKVVLISLKVLL